MTLNELSDIERKLFKMAVAMKGTVQEKEKEIAELGIFEEYQRLHSEYSKQSGDSIEALKRGIFIQWYALVEPSCFTGIRELDKNAENKIIDSLNRILESEEYDEELIWMICYYQKWDYVYDRFDLNEKFYLMKNIEIPKFEKNQMDNRGQMGTYWSAFH